MYEALTAPCSKACCGVNSPGLSKQHGTGSTDAKGVLVNDDGSNDDNEDDDIDAADSLGKAIALVKQVCISMEI